VGAFGEFSDPHETLLVFVFNQYRLQTLLSSCHVNTPRGIRLDTPTQVIRRVCCCFNLHVSLHDTLCGGRGRPRADRTVVCAM